MPETQVQIEIKNMITGADFQDKQNVHNWKSVAIQSYNLYFFLFGFNKLSLVNINKDVNQKIRIIMSHHYIFNKNFLGHFLYV